jgi:signal transduction histidine kinase/DNA-binding response OmpR family regulator
MSRLTFIFLLFINFISLAQKNPVNEDTLLNQANSFFEKSQYDSAYFYGKQAFEKLQHTKQDSLIVVSGLLTARSKDATRSLDSINYIEIIETIALKNNKWQWLMDIYYTKGNTYLRQSEHGKALLVFLKVDSISKEHNFKNPALVKATIKRAEVSRQTFTYEGTENAYIILQEALKIAQAIYSEEMINYTYVYLADVTGMMERLEESKSYIDMAFEYYKRTDDVRMVSRLYLVNSNYYLAIDDVETALKSRKDQVAYLRIKDDLDELASALTYLGNFYRLYTNNHDLAIESFKEAKKIYEDKQATETETFQRLLRGMAIEYKALGDYENSAMFFEEAYNLKLDLVKKENQELTKSLEAKYQTEKKEQEITLLKSQNIVVEQQKTNQRNLLLGGIGLTSIAGLFFFFLYRNRHKTTQKLKELDSFKSRLFANISHEFRTPLTLISGPIDKRLSQKELNEEDRTEFTMIQRNSSRLLNLVNQLLDLSKLESGHLKLKVVQGDLSLFLKALASSFQHTANQKQIDYNIEIAEINHAWFDKDVIEKTIVNLLSNAFKYTPEGGHITFSASIIDNHAIFYIENDSQQFTKTQIDHIFNRFYQIDENAQGVGIGLSLVKELVILSHGTISVENASSNSIAFSVSLPILKTQFKAEELVEESFEPSVIESKNYLVEVNHHSPQEIDEDLPILLIVDDHEDIRNFITSAFKNTYQVVEAMDGERGVAKAIELIPDIIISDVMMPKLNGFQLAEKLKQDERTCHIPIILLTAKADDADRFMGLETGADDYMVKPFKLKGLETRVKNLITSREKLRERYSHEIVLRPKDIAITNFDEQFLEKVQDVLDTKLVESTFNTEDFSKAVGLSRMQLHRKIKALTGLTASEFIRSQRLKLAAQLLKTSDINVSQIGYTVGFNDHSYFAKCFKEAYKCTPTDYAKKHS